MVRSEFRFIQNKCNGDVQSLTSGSWLAGMKLDWFFKDAGRQSFNFWFLISALCRIWSLKLPMESSTYGGVRCYRRSNGNGGNRDLHIYWNRWFWGANLPQIWKWLGLSFVGLKIELIQEPVALKVDSFLHGSYCQRLEMWEPYPDLGGRETPLKLEPDSYRIRMLLLFR